jgi:hypothetical protein
MKVKFNLAKQSRERNRLRGIEYEHQANSRDGNAYIIPNRASSAMRVEKIRGNCFKTDDEVKGWWGPIFTSLGRRGGESQPTLLCLKCYRLACEENAQLEKKYA